MSVKIISFVLTGIILMYGTLVDASLQSVRDKCGIHKDGTIYEMCIMMGHGVLNDKGEWDKKKLDDVLQESWKERGGPPAEVKTVVMNCVDQATGETLIQKTENFFKCLDGPEEEDKKLL